MLVTAAEFKAKCLKLMDEIARTREPIVITKRGKPIAKLMPADEQPPSLFGYMKGKGTVTFLGDIVDSPEVEWNAQKDAEPYEDNELYGPSRKGPHGSSDTGKAGKRK